MDKYAIAAFIVCWIEGFICYLIGYKIGRTHAKRTITHECVKTNADQHVQRVEYVGNVKRCRKCKHIESEHQTPIASDGKYYTYVVCMASECNYEPKDEPTTQTETQNSNLTFEKRTMRDENYIYAYDRYRGEWYPIQEIKTEPQTERSE